jgi:hypothetical protein
MNKLFGLQMVKFSLLLPQKLDLSGKFPYPQKNQKTNQENKEPDIWKGKKQLRFNQLIKNKSIKKLEA